ncbi:phage major capsid protein [Nitratireductor sp. CAU 1489]|uniref:Phage major capsid protein n=1 Tax=Nitratireductor arenosus TaxID=2682096 RepID=A0A844QJT1_9HYPH|nr:phage major capsid protein [Nitratireductor arenosus]MVA98854.1 phage major capsid protein [Nitratireductor arenosus]
MTMALNTRARGLVGVRADSGNAAKILAELQKTFEDFKAERETELKGIEAKFADVVQTEKVDRINAEITNLQKSLDEVNAALAAVKVGGSQGDHDPARAEHAKAFNQFFRKGAEAGLRDLEVKAALRSSHDEDGGYVVPDQTEQGINELLRTVSTLRSLSTSITISAQMYKKLINMQGASSGWVGEEQSRPETTGPTLSALEFPVFEIYANPAATQTVLDDATIDIGGWLASEVQMEFADQEGAAFVSGNGILKPRGILSYDKVANASYAWGKIGYIASGAASAFASSNPADKLIDMVHALRAGYRQNARWLMNDLTVATIRKWKDGQGQYLWQPGMSVGQPASIFGYPVSTDDNMPDVNTDAFPIAFADFRRSYLIVDRQGIRVLRDPFTNKPYVHFYTTKRVGGGVANFESIKLMKIAAS